MIILIWVEWEREREFHILPRVTSVRWGKSIIYLSCCVNIQIQGGETGARARLEFMAFSSSRFIFARRSHTFSQSLSFRGSLPRVRGGRSGIFEGSLSMFHMKPPTHFCFGVISALCVCWIFDERARELRNEVQCFVYYQILLFPIKIREHSSPHSIFFCCLHAYTTTKSDAPSRASLLLCVRNISENVCRFSHRFMSSYRPNRLLSLRRQGSYCFDDDNSGRIAAALEFHIWFLFLCDSFHSTWKITPVVRARFGSLNFININMININFSDVDCDGSVRWHNATAFSLRPDCVHFFALTHASAMRLGDVFPLSELVRIIGKVNLGDARDLLTLSSVLETLSRDLRFLAGENICKCNSLHRSWIRAVAAAVPHSTKTFHYIQCDKI